MAASNKIAKVCMNKQKNQSKQQQYERYEPNQEILQRYVISCYQENVADYKRFAKVCIKKLKAKKIQSEQQLYETAI